MRWIAANCIILFLFASGFAGAESPASRPSASDAPSKFLRFVPEDGGKLQTSIVTYRNADGVQVDLVGAVHIGDAAYYETLNSRFDGYDAVLYEMVRPRAAAATQGAAEGRKPGATTAPLARRSRALGMIGTFQRFLRDHLELEFQLEKIDYDKPNFVHADLDVDTFLQKQEERGESFAKLMLRAMIREMGKGPGAGGHQPNMAGLLAALRAPDRARQLKLVLAKEFHEMEDMLASLEGPKGSVIITERNKAALDVLRQRIEHGDRKLAIFYGAGHYKGMEKTLIEEMGFTQVGEPEWITAWDLSDRPATQPSGAPGR
jgi:hypothetical protein